MKKENFFKISCIISDIFKKVEIKTVLYDETLDCYYVSGFSGIEIRLSETKENDEEFKNNVPLIEIDVANTNDREKSEVEKQIIKNIVRTYIPR